ncbi:hypothetical protein AAU57_11760 [Nonlabens sp. YIK11]|uniref:transglutaminase-like domain-containing protein n=1 Tax=Nonlabens sp. YIK11 TaxID=1453349 RepID=UPI0007076AF8|nr:transglutaminase family protein [Nonlabens sp. YIK11]KQC33929.1 hypothetical protein AAU57_11760 [Nonlabens sp. YIK11]
MALKYQIIYHSKNTYESPLKEALWQFLIIPENNESQSIHQYTFENSEAVPYQESVDGFGNKTLKLRVKKPIHSIEFTARIELVKEDQNPFAAVKPTDPTADFKALDQLVFKVDHESFLTPTELTTIPKQFQELFKMDRSTTVFQNLLELTKWSFNYFTFKTEVTTTESTITEILTKKQGVCQDFTHVFCGMARLNGIPARYVSGYLHQDNGLVGDLQMHAWVECFIPGNGWIGFDPTNNLMAAGNHIKVTHGRDYKDCAPIKGVVYLSGNGSNETTYTVRVKTVEEFAAGRIFNKIQTQSQEQNYKQDQILMKQMQWQQQQQQ